MGKVANTYKRRISALDSGRARFRGDVAKILVSALQQATDEELTDRSPLPQTGRMRGSIQSYFTGANEVQAGFNLAKAPYAKRRLNLKGTSKTGGHKLDMNPAPIVRRIADPKIKKLASGLLRKIANP